MPAHQYQLWSVHDNYIRVHAACMIVYIYSHWVIKCWHILSSLFSVSVTTPVDQELCISCCIRIVRLPEMQTLHHAWLLGFLNSLRHNVTHSHQLVLWELVPWHSNRSLHHRHFLPGRENQWPSSISLLSCSSISLYCLTSSWRGTRLHI